MGLRYEDFWASTLNTISVLRETLNCPLIHNNYRFQSIQIKGERSKNMTRNLL